MPARVAASEVPLCEPCVHDAGLCRICAPSVLPQLKQASWQRDAHRGHNHVTVKLSPEGEKIRQRKERKRAKRSATERLRISLAGGFAAVGCLA